MGCRRGRARGLTVAMMGDQFDAMIDPLVGLYLQTVYFFPCVP
jgi:hypothetical protein